MGHHRELNEQKIYILNTLLYYSMLDRNYIAGFFDGEGSIYLLESKKNKSIFLCVNLTNTEKKVLDKIKEQYGGSISKSKDVRGRKQLYRLRLYSNIGLNLLEDIKDLLIIKKNKAILAIEFQNRTAKNIRMRGENREISFEEQKKYKELVKNA